MALYRILLVDDEEEIREGIIQKIEWEALGYEVVGDAENGVDALEKADALHPDVVMTDIKMPFMDGLELAGRLSTLMPSTKIVIFSGFDDFEYAQKAIKINVAEYILKPINAAELTETLKRLKIQLDLALEERRDIETLRRNYMESLPVLREQFLVGLLEGRVERSQIEAQAKRYDMNSEADAWAVALVRADAVNEAGALKGEEELVPISLKYTLEAELANYCTFTDFLYSGCVAVIAELDASAGAARLVTGMNAVCKSAEKLLGARVTAGVGTPCASLAELRHSYREAQNALDYSTVPGAGRAIYIGDIERDTLIKIQFDERDEREIIGTIKFGSEEAIRSRVSELFARFETEALPFSQYQVYLMEITAALLKLLYANQLRPEEILGENRNYASVLTELRTPEEMKRWCTDCCLKISALIKRERVDAAKLLAENAKDFVARNFQKPDLSVEDLSSFLHVSPTYFSTVFKRETGMNFVAYLTESRLQKALAMLNGTDDKTYIIAEKVGYTEPNYFSYVFKKKFGVSPSKYRNRA